VIEAMAAGCRGGHGRQASELVDDGKTAGSCRRATRGSRHALNDLLDEPRLAAELGRAARHRVEQMYSFDRMVDQFTALYLSELNGRGHVTTKEVA
jgi:glycosyltransferase involved in cell wall biosynthesis